MMARNTLRLMLAASFVLVPQTLHATDGAWWSGFAPPPAGAGLDDCASPMIEYDGGILVGGCFTDAGGTTVGQLAKWDGTQWHALPGVFNANVNDLAIFQGDLYVCGLFTEVSGQTVNHIARFDGSSWQPVVDDGVIGVDAALDELHVHDDSVLGLALFVGGYFESAGTVDASRVAAWDGVSWHRLLDGVYDPHSPTPVKVLAMTSFRGDLIVGGHFEIADHGTVNNIARWDGTTWWSVREGFNGQVNALTVHAGELYAGGYFTSAFDGISVKYVARWGEPGDFTWHPLGDGLDSWVFALASFGDDLVVGGGWNVASPTVSTWDGGSWDELDGGVGGNNECCWGGGTQSPRVFGLLEDGDDLLVTGGFSTAGGVPSANIARWSRSHAPIADADSLSGQPEVIYAGGAYHVTATYTDPDGPTDLKHCYLRLEHPDSTGLHLTIAWDQATDTSYPWAGSQGGDFLEHWAAEAEPTPEGYSIRWSFAINRDWPPATGGVRFSVNAEDDAGAQSAAGWDADESSTAFRMPLPGVTVLVHGYSFFGDFQDGIAAWGYEFIRAVLQPHGGGRVYQYARATGTFEPVAGFEDVGPESTHVVLVHDWTAASNQPASGYAESAAEALLAALLTLDLNGVAPVDPVTGSGPPLHFIGHSRGATVCSETVQRLTTHGIPVDYVTFLDPHDFDEPGAVLLIDGVFHDPAVQVWQGTTYADNFWQDAELDACPSGRAVAAVLESHPYECRLDSLPGFDDAEVALPGNNAHGRVRDWYRGTLDPARADDRAPEWYPDGVGYDAGFRHWLAGGGFERSDVSAGLVAGRVADPNDLGTIVPYGLYDDPDDPGDDGNPDIPDGDRDDADPHLFNGDQELDDLWDAPPRLAGWHYFGGDGEGYLSADDDERFLRLATFPNDYRTHNRVYVPVTAVKLRFRWRIASQGPAVLQVLLEEEFLGQRALDVARDEFAPDSLAIDESLCDDVATITFRIQPPGMAAIVDIDDVSFSIDSPLSTPVIAVRPARVRLSPTPFNASVMVRFDVPRIDVGRVTVYDVAGRLVRQLLPATTLHRGTYELIWDGRTDTGVWLPNGAYFVNLTTGNTRTSVRAVIMR